MKTYGFDFYNYKKALAGNDNPGPIIVVFDSHEALADWLSLASWDNKADVPHLTRIKVTRISLKSLLPDSTYSEIEEALKNAYKK